MKTLAVREMTQPQGQPQPARSKGSPTQPPAHPRTPRSEDRGGQARVAPEQRADAGLEQRVQRVPPPCVKGKEGGIRRYQKRRVCRAFVRPAHAPAPGAGPRLSIPPQAGLRQSPIKRPTPKKVRQPLSSRLPTPWAGAYRPSVPRICDPSTTQGTERGKGGPNSLLPPLAKAGNGSPRGRLGEVRLRATHADRQDIVAPQSGSVRPQLLGSRAQTRASARQPKRLRRPGKLEFRPRGTSAHAPRGASMKSSPNGGAGPRSSASHTASVVTTKRATSARRAATSVGTAGRRSRSKRRTKRDGTACQGPPTKC